MVSRNEQAAAVAVDRTSVVCKLEWPWSEEASRAVAFRVVRRAIEEVCYTQKMGKGVGVGTVLDTSLDQFW